MDGPPQVSDAFAVDHSHLINAFFPAGGQVSRKQFFNVSRVEGVQIQFPFNGDLNGLLRLILKIIRAHCDELILRRCWRSERVVVSRVLIANRHSRG